MDITILNETLSYEIIVKLVIAATLSLIIGIERELKKKPVGLKTSLVIATFSCLLTIISIEAAYTTPSRDDINITMDPLRLAAQIVSGIGFLGAGVILRKGNDSITGLTTAAMIWGAAGIGIAVGAGFYIEAFITVVIVVVGIELIAPFLLKIGPKRIRMKELVLKALLKDEENIQNLLTFMRENEMHIDNIRIRDVHVTADNALFEVDIRFSALFKKDTISIYRTLHTLPYVQKIELESLG
ncbi:MgtC/SapB family protein [Ureibacillus chungkukjangi]|uniref:Putative Mg2+ transporter-C (MgtC) family protein n=1 Tax=Ureibacillus chungkukjangi TaxID=1202712 RepID=A0A318TIP7_9BACL|nr:MgtC/SapB family protein [Ureibacillus chungkukjangi]MCM3388224.1 MgtC/SapB family protein [Ureibacillus chungkukjangi]PYF03700.1 putative Mg2+ transporter-C (MgtC) family protein [Ureibacillus chungkukjangi]